MICMVHLGHHQCDLDARPFQQKLITELLFKIFLIYDRYNVRDGLGPFVLRTIVSSDQRTESVTHFMHCTQEF